MPEDRDLKKILDDLKKQLKSDPKTPYDQTDLFQELKDKIEEENRKSGEKTEAALKEETEVLKEGNEHNKAMNIAQIAKEVFTFRREKAADEASRKSFDKIQKNQEKADKNTQKQIKHNRGAKEAREIMLEQNMKQLQNDNATAAQLEEIQNTNQNILNILQQTVEGPEGAQKGDLKKGSDGHVYEYEGAQWVDQKTGKMATRQMAQELNTNPTTTSAPRATAGTGPQVVKVEVANTEELSQATKDVETEERRASQPASQPESRRGQRAQPTAETTRPLSPEEIAELANKTTRGGEALDDRSKRSGFGMSDEAYARQRQRDEASMERIAKRKDIQNKSAEVSTNKDALNLDKIAQDELDTGAQRLGMDETLRVRGRHGKAVNYSRYETGYGGKDKDPSEQTAKFGGRDDDGKWLGLQDTDPIRELAEDINISQGVVGTTRNRTQSRVSQSSATMFKAIGESGSAVQKALEENPQAREDFDKLTKLMQKIQTGKGDDKTVAELQTQIERLKMTGGEDLAKNLNLDQVQKDAKGGFFKNLGEKVKTDFFGVNMGTDLFSAKGLGEIFSADRIFGTAGSGKAANISALQGTNQFVENATRQLEEESQDEAQRRYESNTYLVDDKPASGTSKMDEWREKWIPEENREATATAAAPQQAAQMEEEVPDEAAGSKPAKRKSKREKMVSERTGVSKDQDKLATEETLKKILERLENMSGIGGPGGGGGGGFGLDDAAMAAGGASVAGGGGLMAGLKAKGKAALGKIKGVGSKAGGLLKGAASGAGKALGGAGRALGAAARFAGPVGLAITAGASLYGGYKGFTADKDASFGRKMMNAGSGALNTLSFGLLGTDPEDMAAEGQQRRTLESAEESGLYDKDLLGNSEIDRTKIYDATPEQLQAILDDDDLNESDRKVVEDALTQKTTSPERQAEIRKRENDEFAFGTAVPIETRSEGAVMYDEEFLKVGPPPIDATREGYRSEGNLPKGVGTATPVKKGMVIPSNTDGANVVGAEAKASGGMVIPGTEPLITATSPELVPDLGPGKEKAGLLGKIFGGEGVGDAITTGLAAVVPGGMIAKSMFEGGKGEGLISKAGEFLGLGSAEKAVTPTADAVTNMSRLGKEADQMASAPIVVNNTNNQSAPAEKAGQDNMLAVMTEPEVRLRTTSALVRAQDRRFI